MLMIRTIFSCAIILCFIAVNNAAPSRFQRLECPDDNLKVYVNTTESDRIEHEINETNANSLLECTQKCYNNPQCFSLKYREADPTSCKLTSFVPETCLDITLVPVAGIKYDASTLITIDCITCQSTEESGTRVSSDDTSRTLFSTVENTNASVSASSLCDPSSMQCREDLWFIAEEVTNSENLDFLEETVTANSVQECAKMCFNSCCKMAIYSTNKKKCQFTKESASSSDDDSCETKPFSFYVKQHNESNRTRITCVTCDSPSKSDRRMLVKSSENRLAAENSAEITGKDENEKVEKSSGSSVLSQFSSSEQPIIASALDTFSSSQDKESLFQPLRPQLQFMEMACIVVFEVDPNADTAHFRSQDNVEADRADHCAYLCYRDACTAAVFIPPAAPGRKGSCERRFDVAEKCNATLRRDYYYKTTKSIYLQCFRCLPEKPQTKATHGAVTPQPESSLVTVKKQPSETLIITQAEATLTTLRSTSESSVELETFGTKEVKGDISGTTVSEAASRNMEIISAEGRSKDESKQTEGSNLTGTTTPKISDELKDSSTEQTLESTTSESEDSIVTLSTAAEHESTTSRKIFETDLTTSGNDSGTNMFESPSSVTSDVEHTEQSVQENELVQTTKSKVEASESSQFLTSEKSQKFTKATTSAGADFSAGSRSRIEAEIKDSHNAFALASGTHSDTEETTTSSFVVFTERNEDSANEHSSSTTMSVSTHVDIDGQKETVHKSADDEEVEVTRSVGSSEVNVGSTEAVSSNPEGKNEAVAPSNSFATSSASADKPTLALSKGNSKKPPENAAEAFYTYLQGCIVTFQADPHSERPAQSSTGFQASTIARTAEVCAGRCYQDGCTGAKYDPSSKECVLGYGGKQICNKGPEHFFYEANETIWIHCTGCKLHKPGDEGINIMIHSLKSKAAKETTTVRGTVTGGMTTLSATVTETEERMQSTKPEKTLEMSSGTTVAGLDLSMAEGKAKTENEITEASTSSSLPSSSLVAATQILAQTAELSTTPQEELTTETTGKKVETPEEELNIDGVPTSAIAEKAEELVNHEKSSVPFETALFGHGCTISFQAKPIASLPEPLTAEFISRGTTATVEACAKQCYVDGCTGAKFSPINRECSLIFGDHHQCDEKEEKYHSIEATETLWIHCISCKREFTENTLGLLTEDTTHLAVDVGTTSDKSVGEAPAPLVGVSETSMSLGNERISEEESTTKEAELDFQVFTSTTESVRFPANVSEIGSEKSTAIGEEVDTAPVVIVVEEQGTPGFSTLQPSQESSEHFDLNQQIGAISTEASIMEQSSKLTGDAEQQKTVLPDDLISMTLQTPLNVPTDDLGLLNINTGISDITSSATRESSTMYPLKEIEFGGRKDQKEDSVEFQKENKPTTLLVEITASSVPSNEVTVHPEIVTLEEQKFNEVADDTIGAAANVVANISSSVPETINETSSEIKPTGIPKLSEPEVSSSFIGSETAFKESDAKVTLFNADETFHTTEASVKSDFESEAPDELIEKVNSKAILTATGTISEVDKEETSTVLISQESTEETSNIPERNSEEKNDFDGTLLSGSVENSITAQPFVQENVDDIIKKVIQSVSEKDISAVDAKSELSDSSVPEEAKEVGELGVVADREGKLSIIEDTSAKGTTTEPPVQAVSDLISVISQNSRIEGLIGHREKDSPVTDGSLLRMDKNEVMNTGIQEDSARNSLQNVIKISSFKGATVDCFGRVEFEISRVDDLSKLNISSKVAVRSPAACAMRCYETTNCVLAAYVPSRNDESTKATCMLTSNSGVCSPEEKFLAQYKSDSSPFVISCLKCTKCNYTISAVTELTRIRQAEVVEPALSVGQCAEICWRHNCTVSQYDYKSNLCSLTSIKGQDDCPKELPIAVESDELVLLKCVRCFT